MYFSLDSLNTSFYISNLNSYWMLKNINVDETTPYSKYILIVYIQRASFSAEKGIILNKVIMNSNYCDLFGY